MSPNTSKYLLGEVGGDRITPVEKPWANRTNLSILSTCLQFLTNKRGEGKGVRFYSRLSGPIKVTKSQKPGDAFF